MQFLIAVSRDNYIVKVGHCLFHSGYYYRIQRGDSARYFILHHFGGVYLDLDITCIVPIDSVLSTFDLTKIDTLVSDVPGPGLIDNPIIISKKANPFMEFCMEKLVVMNHYYLLPFLTVYFSTGPYFVSLTYLQFPCLDTVFRMDVKYTRTLYFLHQQSSSWHTWDHIIIRFFDHGIFLLLVLAVIVFRLSKLKKSRWKTHIKAY